MKRFANKVKGYGAIELLVAVVVVILIVVLIDKYLA